jgi:hypothetical protein
VGLLRPKFGSGAVSGVRSVLPNPFETKRIFDAHRVYLGVCTGKVAEEKALAANSLSF